MLNMTVATGNGEDSGIRAQSGARTTSHSSGMATVQAARGRDLCSHRGGLCAGARSCSEILFVGSMAFPPLVRNASLPATFRGEAAKT